jgi:Ca-activated chloride channel homolog
MRIRIAAALIVVVLLAAWGATAPDRGDLVGTVLDTQGAALPGVAVQLSGPESRRTFTDTRGEFAFQALVPGAYVLRFELAGFRPARQAVSIRAEASERVSVRLSAASLSETVTANAETPAAAPVPPASPREVQLDSVHTAPKALIAGGVAGGVVGGKYVPSSPDFPFDRYVGPLNTEAYDHLDENPFRRVAADPLSTFSIDVDTASYANARRFLTSGQLPPAGAVRIEELINYFRFEYPNTNGDTPFSVTTELTQCPWNPRHHLVLIGLQGRELPEVELPPRNLVFLLDVSGSMMPPDKLPLVRTAMRMLADQLTARDRVAIVVYAGSEGLVLPSTPADRKARIYEAIDGLEAGGSTNGGAGIRLAYRIARDNFIRGGVNRVVLATDGDFNVGVTSQDELVRLIEEQRASGVFLSVLGVGTGNLKDSTMEKLADKGNGNYSYLDSLHEARKVLVREAGGTLVTIAKDVKIQVEFNPKAAAGYRLIGYENRILRHEDFNDDKKDAGEIGAGHSVTALYEVVPAGVDVPSAKVDPLKYQTPAQPSGAASSDELMTVKLRYKAPDGDESRLVSATVRNRPEPMRANIAFASAVAEFGMLLRGSQHAPAASYGAAIDRARRFKRDDPDGTRAEFVKLAELAMSLGRMQTDARRQQ